MKGKIVYIIGILLLFLVLFLFNENSDRKRYFDWNPTYRQWDKNPFGGSVFDGMLEASWKGEYIHSYKNISRLIEEGKLTDQNVLVIAEGFSTWDSELETFLDYVAEGHKIMIVSSWFDDLLQDTLCFQTSSDGWFAPWMVEMNTDTLKEKRNLSLCVPGVDEIKYAFPRLTCSSYFDSIPDIDARIISLNDSNQIVAFRTFVGKGEIILCSTPMLFTNYGILSDNNEYIWTLLSYLKGADLLRTEYYQVGNEEESQSPFRYLLQHRSLRWALYLSLLTILLFIIFTAKRKQRVIPVVKDPENHLLHFVRSIAALYLKKSDNTDILQKKYLIFAEQLLKDYHVDIINKPHDLQLFDAVALKTGNELRTIRALFNGLDKIDSDFEITDKELMELVVQMDRIVRKTSK